MSFEYLALKRTRKHMVIGHTPKAVKEFPINSIVYWLISSQVNYRNSSIPAVFSEKAEIFLERNVAEALRALGDLSSAGSLLVSAVTHACEAPAWGDLDENLALINLAHEHARKISQVPIPKVKIGFTTKKHRDTPHTRLMTVKGDPVGLMGLEAAGLALATLRAAVAKDLKVTIAMTNMAEIFGADYQGYRPAPKYTDIKIWVIRGILVDYLTKELSLDRAKESLGAIKVLCDHFAQFQVSASEASRA